MMLECFTPHSSIRNVWLVKKKMPISSMIATTCRENLRSRILTAVKMTKYAKWRTFWLKLELTYLSSK